MTIILKKDEFKKIIYTGTGDQEEIIFDIFGGYPIGGTINIEGGATDVFTLKTKIAEDWNDSISSSSGKIQDLAIVSKGKGFLLNITTNISGSIKLEILV